MAASFPFSVVISAVDRLTGPVGRMEGGLGKLAAASTRVGRRLSLGVSAPILAAGAATIASSASFEQGMSRVQALSGATGEALASLRLEARELGRSTEFSATQAAQAMAEFAIRGFSVQEQLAATAPTLDLATAANLDLAEAARVAGGVFRAQGRDGLAFRDVVDLITLGFTKSANEAVPFSEALASALPVARAVEVPITDLSAALSVLGDNMQTGTEAGTGLRRTLTNLASLTRSKLKLSVLEDLGIRPEELYADGRIVGGIIALARRLRDAGANLEHVNALFGEFGGPKILTLIGAGEDALAAAELRFAGLGGQAEQTASIMRDNTLGAVQVLTSSLESLNITLGDTGLLESFRKGIERLTTWVQILERLNPNVLRATIVVAGLAAAVGPLLLGFGLAAHAVLGVKGALVAMLPVAKAVGGFIATTLVPAVWGFTTALLANPVVLVTLAVVGLLGALVLLARHWDGFAERARRVGSAITNAVTLPFQAAGRVVQELVGAIPDWLLELVGLEGGAAGAAAAAGASGRAATSDEFLRAALATRPESVIRRENKVRLSFEGLPDGVRLVPTGDAGPDVDLDLGFGLAGV